MSKVAEDLPLCLVRNVVVFISVPRESLLLDDRNFVKSELLLGATGFALVDGRGYCDCVEGAAIVVFRLNDRKLFGDFFLL